MNQRLKDFIPEWNKTHQHLTFSYQETPVNARPVSIEIRYPAEKYHDFFSTEPWDKLNEIVEKSSHDTMYITTNERLFKRGIIEAKVASQNRTYQEQYIVETLRWIGKYFFPQENHAS